jgi:hypothetical protein
VNKISWGRFGAPVSTCLEDVDARAVRVPGEDPAEPVGPVHQFYAYCSVDLLGVPVACTQTDEAHASHICQYLATPLGVGLDCIQRSAA